MTLFFLSKENVLSNFLFDFEELLPRQHGITSFLQCWPGSKYRDAGLTHFEGADSLPLLFFFFFRVLEKTAMITPCILLKSLDSLAARKNTDVIYSSIPLDGSSRRANSHMPAEQSKGTGNRSP